MGLIRDRMEALKVAATSADGSVSIRLDRTKGIRARIDPASMAHHSESSLEWQLQSALSAAMRGYTTKVDKIRAEIMSGWAKPAPDAPLVKQQAALAKAVTALHISANSPQRYVRIEWVGEADFTVRLDPGCVGRISASQLAEEFNRAMASATRDRTQRLLHDRRRISESIMNQKGRSTA